VAANSAANTAANTAEDITVQASAALRAETSVGATMVQFYGTHQAGVETPFQTYGVFLGFDLLPDATLVTARRMMELLTDDAARLGQGDPALPDNDPYLAENPARLTATFGFGPGFFSKLGLQSKMPAGFADLPAYRIDKLVPEFSGGDLVISIGADDPMTLAHTARQLTRTARSFSSIRWSQRGFVRSQGVAPATHTPRNLFGQVDGTINPAPGTEAFAGQVWAEGSPSWFAGGTQLVLRRISMNLDTWDKLDEGGKEISVGRKLHNGAPLTGVHEFDAADMEAKNSAGLAVIPHFAHMRRARTDNPHEKFLRRPLNYDDGILLDGTSNSGLLFAAYMANIETQYVPVQQRLADLDLLNTWTTPIGSAVFALPPGCLPGGFIGEGLLS
jgi:dye decolorizing peroxidase